MALLDLLSHLFLIASLISFLIFNPFLLYSNSSSSQGNWNWRDTSFLFFNICESTNFSISDNIGVNLSGEYTDINAFYSLSNVNGLYYYDDIANKSIKWDQETSFQETIENIQGLRENTFAKK